MNHAIGIDLGGTFIKYAIVATDGTIVYQSKVPTEGEKGRQQVINNILFCLEDARKQALEKELTIVGAGLGTPGVVDGGHLLGGAENLPEWEDLDLEGELSKGFELPVYIDNDANLMGLGEVRFGSAQSLTDVIFLTIGTGVGGAMVLNGELYGGYRNRGAELGHVIVDQGDEPCSCGSKGCLETYASVTALIRDYNRNLEKNGKAHNPNANGKLIVENYHKGEAEAVEAMNAHFDYLAAGIIGFINIFSPQKIVIGGGISEAGDFYLDEIRKRVDKDVMKETSMFTEICTADLGNNAGFMGAAALVFSKLKTEVVSI